MGVKKTEDTNESEVMDVKNENLADVSMDNKDLFPEISMEQEPESTEEVQTPKSKKSKPAPREEVPVREEDELISCLTNKRVFVRLVPKQSGMFTNPKHEYAGNMAPTSTRTYTVPVNRKGVYVNILTNSEKAFLEEYMGLEPNALSVYKKVDNYWENYKVVLHKEDNILDLSDPNQYIDYKVLLANKDLIAPSLDAMNEEFKATYQYVIVEEYEEERKGTQSTNINMRAYMALGSIREDVNKMTYVLAILSGRTIRGGADILLPALEEYMQTNPKLFLDIVEDPLLGTKMLIKEAVKERVIKKIGDFYYINETSEPLCEKNAEPTLTNAARYLNAPRHQEVRFTIEAKLNRR